MHLIYFAAGMCPARHLDQSGVPCQRVRTIQVIEPAIGIGMQEAAAARK